MTISVNMMLKIHGRFEIPHVWIGEKPDLNVPHLEIIRLLSVSLQDGTSIQNRTLQG
jgi:hypothetical protein